jgi:hypothetical protein
MNDPGWQVNYGMVVRDPGTGELIDAEALAATMTSPVLCRCGQLFDMAAVKVTARFADCSVFDTPCCSRQVDDRVGVNHGLTRLTGRS